MAADDAQVIEGNGAHLVESDEDVAAHFFDGLREKMKVSKKIKSNMNVKLNVYADSINANVKKNTLALPAVTTSPWCGDTAKMEKCDNDDAIHWSKSDSHDTLSDPHPDSRIVKNKYNQRQNQNKTQTRGALSTEE